MNKRIYTKATGLSRLLVAMIILTMVMAMPGTYVAHAEDTGEAEATADVWDGTVAEGFAGGSGTEGDPYQIATAEQLAYFSQYVNNNYAYDEYFKLTNDIVLNSSLDGKPLEWTPIGNGNNAFMGTFDGNNHTIEGVYVTGEKDYVGLFGESQQCVIKNLSVINSSVSGNINVGGIIGLLKGSSITNCSYSGYVTGRAQVGGICGCAGSIKSSVEDCYFIGEIKAVAIDAFTPESIGGICGRLLSSGEIINCLSYGTINVNDENATCLGAICGSPEGNCNIVNCYYNKDVCDVTDNYGTGLESVEMTGSNVLNLIGFDIGVWGKMTNDKANSIAYYPDLLSISGDKPGIGYETKVAIELADSTETIYYGDMIEFNVAALVKFDGMLDYDEEGEIGDGEISFVLQYDGKDMTSAENPFAVYDNSVALLEYNKAQLPENNIPAGKQTLTLEYSGATSEYFSDGTTTVEVNINRAAATWEAADPTVEETLTYGQSLKELSLPEGWKWSDEDMIPNAGTACYNAEYDLKDSNYDYSSDKGYDSEKDAIVRAVEVTVNKAEAAPNAPKSKMSVSYDKKKISDVALPDGWTWKASDKSKSLTVGKAISATAEYTAADAGNYENVTANVAVTRTACTHANTEIRNKVEATYDKEGYTGDTCCKDCGATLKTGTKVAKLVKGSANVSYEVHVQSLGWQDKVSNGAVAGTTGISKRLEAIKISVDAEGADLGIQYTTHCQSYGWLPWSANGELNGTESEAKRLEAIMIQLTGEDADEYDVYYRVHAQLYGWLGWAKNGKPAGTAGYAKRLEGIQIVVVKKGESIDTKLGNITSVMDESYVAKEGASPVVGGTTTDNTNPVIPGDSTVNVAYKTHVQTYGWQGWKYNGAVSGTVGQSKRLEGIDIKLTNAPYSGSIAYTTHVQSYGWQEDVNNSSTWKKDGEMSGTSGEAKRLEAICITLTGELAEHYDVYYRVHAQSYGWLGWAKNGAPAGTAGYSKRLEGIQIVLVPKNGQEPADNYGGVTSANADAYIEK